MAGRAAVELGRSLLCGYCEKHAIVMEDGDRLNPDGTQHDCAGWRRIRRAEMRKVREAKYPPRSDR